MRRYLLFGGHCTHCSRIARAVREVAGGRVEARSLYDPEMRTLVEQVRPNGKPEPLLLEADGDNVRVRSGLAMRTRLLRVLGPGRAFRLAERITRGDAAENANGLGRRKVLTRVAGLAVVGGGVLAGVGVSGAANAKDRSGSGEKRQGNWVTDEATLDLLRRTNVVKAATSAYGEPLWHRVLRAGTDAEPAYVLRHPGDPVTFTVVQDPAKAGRQAFGLSYRIYTPAGQLRIDLLRPTGGERLVRTEVDEAGVTTHTLPDGRWARATRNGKLAGPLMDAHADIAKDGAGIAAGADPTDPQAWLAFLGCMLECATPRIPDAATPCLSCAAQGGQGPSCVGCAVAVATIVVMCGVECWDKFPIPVFQLDT